MYNNLVCPVTQVAKRSYYARYVVACARARLRVRLSVERSIFQQAAGTRRFAIRERWADGKVRDVVVTSAEIAFNVFDIMYAPRIETRNAQYNFPCRPQGRARKQCSNVPRAVFRSRNWSDSPVSEMDETTFASVHGEPFSRYEMSSFVRSKNNNV